MGIGLRCGCWEGGEGEGLGGIKRIRLGLVMGVLFFFFFYWGGKGSEEERCCRWMIGGV